MYTAEEIRSDWKVLRSALGNLICHIDGRMEQLKSLEDAYLRGVNDGSLDAKDRVGAAIEKGYEECWEIATRIVKMDARERAKVFFTNSEAVTHEEPFKSYTVHEAIQLLKTYDAKKADEEDLQFIRFLYNVIQPNEMEQYRAMYRTYSDPNCIPSCGAEKAEEDE